MPKLRIIYILSLVMLAVLTIFTIFQPMATAGKYSEMQRERLLETESEWIVQFAIINYEGKDQNYTINALVGEKSYTDTVLIQDGGRYSYIHHIRRDMLTDGEVSFAIHKEGEADPFEQATYHLK